MNILMAIVRVTLGTDCKLSNCIWCNTASSDICLECDSGYGLILNNCYKCNDDNCIDCKNNILKCTLCEEDYFVANDGSCGPISSSCLKNCKRCLDSGICGECKEYYTLGLDNICYSMNERFLRSSTHSHSYSSSSSGSSTSSGIWIGIGLGIGAILFIAAYCYYRRRRRLIRLQANPVNASQNIGYSGIVNPPDPLYPHLQNCHDDYAALNQSSAGISIPTPIIYNPDLIEISQLTFNSTVPLVTLDENFAFYGEKICAVCKSEFSPKFDHRMLPCKHVFHGECIYKHMIIQNQKFCPVDNVQYR